mmetsp:Transcript_14604/g.18372  ORF Transcript_14604/g.18372 Transcript_14604/m.18372 type:complete len:209 (-) Transcript_14604:822-1448(-)
MSSIDWCFECVALITELNLCDTCAAAAAQLHNKQTEYTENAKRRGSLAPSFEEGEKFCHTGWFFGGRFPLDDIACLAPHLRELRKRDFAVPILIDRSHHRADLLVRVDWTSTVLAQEFDGLIHLVSSKLSILVTVKQVEDLLEVFHAARVFSRYIEQRRPDPSGTRVDVFPICQALHFHTADTLADKYLLKLDPPLLFSRNARTNGHN